MQIFVKTLTGEYSIDAIVGFGSGCVVFVVIAFNGTENWKYH